VNFVTAHDGFTLADLVAYEHRRNDANGEGGRDGSDHDRSWNCGIEGPTDDPDVLALRRRQQRNLLTTLLVARGVPMLVAGDELGRTQQGNNNPYNQDNEISWLDWAAADEDLLAFTRRLVAFRLAHPVFRRRRFLVGIEAAELAWFTPSATPMTMDNWADPNARALSIYLDCGDAPDLAEDGTPLLDDDFLVLVNGWWEKLGFRIPDVGAARTWRVALDTYDPTRTTGPEDLRARDDITLSPQSIVVLQSKGGT
jgi:glycogen operon protein